MCCASVAAATSVRFVRRYLPPCAAGGVQQHALRSGPRSVTGGAWQLAACCGSVHYRSDGACLCCPITPLYAARVGGPRTSTCRCLQTKPRILICTPSNAACDELLTRVMTDGFCDGSGAGVCGGFVGGHAAGGAAQLRRRSPSSGCRSSFQAVNHGPPPCLHLSQAAHTGPTSCVWAARWAAPSTPLCATAWWG